MEEKLAMAAADLEVIMNRLGELANLISTIHLGLAKEKAEQQVLDCMMCIWYCVKDIHVQAQQAMLVARQTQQERPEEPRAQQETSRHEEA